MTAQQHKLLAYDLTMEYFRQNNIMGKHPESVDKIVENFAEFQRDFYDAITDSLSKFDKLF